LRIGSAPRRSATEKVPALAAAIANVTDEYCSQQPEHRTGASVAPKMQVVMNWLDELKRLVPTK
jgi:hypothetical protein